MTSGEAGGTGTAGPRVMVVGAGWHITSGISYYTCSLSNALAETLPTSTLLMRQLVPTALYPGRSRVGRRVHDLEYAGDVEVYDGLDWSWGPSMKGASDFLRTQRPDVLVLQWWTGAVLHSYLRLARQAARQGAKVVVEWHEVQDSGEARVPGVTRYVRALIGRLLRRADAHVVHSTHDRDLLEAAWGLSSSGAPTVVVPHGPYPHVLGADEQGHHDDDGPGTDRPGSEQPDAGRPDRFRLLYFGIIRPYKGLEDLVAAFHALPADVRDAFELTIVGETWEGWHAPLDAVAAGPGRAQVTVVNRYVTDAEARRHFAEADAVVLPYRRSSSSGPLQMAMSAGLPVVVTAVGGLVEAVEGYDGARLVPPADPTALAACLVELLGLRGRRFADVRSWDATVASYRDLFAAIGVPGADLPTRSES